MKYQVSTFVCLALSTALAAQEQNNGKPGTYEVKPQPIRVTTTVPGVFESFKASEVKAPTKQLTSLSIDRAVAAGSMVKKGQPIVWFQTEKIDRQVKEAEYGLRLAELAMRDSELAMSQLQTTQKLDRQQIEQTRRSAQQKYDNFVKIDHLRNQLSAKFSLKNSQASYENALEELRQLEKMYKEDELTEESEEIVLKRTRQSVENAKFRLEGTEISTKRSLEQSIPLELQQVKAELTRQELTYEKAIKDLETARQRKTIELEKQQFALEKQQRDLAQLREDRKHPVLIAPMEGVVYYGQFARGRVGDPKTTPKLTNGSTVTNSQVLMTIVDTKALQLRIDLEEKHLQNLGVGDQGVAIPTGFPNRYLNAKVKSVAFVPIAANKYDCVATVQLDKQTPVVMAGMTCSVELVVYQKDDALMVPDAAVFGKGEKRFVYVQPNGQAAKKRLVVIGNKADGKTEIVSGLKAGELVLLKKPS